LLTLRENATRPQNPKDLASDSDERFRGRTASAAGTSDAAADARGTGTAVVLARTANDVTGTGTAADGTAAGMTEITLCDRHRDAVV